MWPLVIGAGALWYLSRPRRNPQPPRRSAPEASTELASEIVARAVQYRRDLERLRGDEVMKRLTQKNASNDEATYRQALRAWERLDARADQLIAEQRDERRIAAAREAAQQALDEKTKAWSDWQFTLRLLSTEEWKVKKEAARLEGERASIYAQAGVDGASAKSRLGRERLRQLRALMQPFQPEAS